ncbi:MAG: DUF2267 domain-containing protein [Chitinivibrionales bacterium]|nr:DUF2267 domain-containing protein [Chitinivibrionales bacterium]MBD3358761.1 DUF2267 domain-containing protein [Chitinivibrionales bacterium]
MNIHDFYAHASYYAQLNTEADARRATEATLRTLGELLHRTERHRLAAQLPRELKDFLFERHEIDGQDYSLEEFYNRVGARAEVRYAEAVRWSRGVIAALRLAVTAGEMDSIFSLLRSEYAELVEGPHGPLSATVERER